MKCDKCGYDDNGTGDTAHYCGKLPALKERLVLNPRLKELMLEAGYAAPEIAGRAHKLAELLVKECTLQCHHNDDMDRIEKHFGVE
jgi:hypothetical protein